MYLNFLKFFNAISKITGRGLNALDIIISRAFKPLPVIFEIALKNFKKFKYIILFLGKSGKEILKEASKKWKFDYEEKKSLTNDESLIVKISNLRKKKRLRKIF